MITQKNDAKFDEGLTRDLKNNMGNLAYFDPTLKSFKNLHFNELFLIKVYNV